MPILSVMVVLFLVMDPLGNMPLFVSILKDVPAQRKNKVILREAAIAFLILVFFLLFGKFFLTLLQIDQQALNVAGGIVLFLIAIKMIFPPNEEGGQEKLHGEPFIVPLAVPLIAGPSAMSVVLIMTTKEPDKTLQLFLALTIACVLNGIVLLLSHQISKIMGRRGMIAVERLMGMILITISVQMFLTGIARFFKI